MFITRGKLNGYCKKIVFSLIIAAICTIIVFIGVKFKQLKEPTIDLTQFDSKQKPEDQLDTNSASLRFAVATMWSVESTYIMYQRLVHRIGNDVGLNDSFILRSSYNALRKAIEKEEIDVAFVCTGPYVYALPSGRIKLLVQPEFIEGHQYHSILMTSPESNISSMENLQGTVIGFSDPESFTGYMVPYVMLSERGINPATFFKKIIFTGSHDRSIYALDRGIVNAAAVHSIVWESAKREDPTLSKRLKVIWESETYGPPPVIIRKSLDENLVNALRNAFLNLNKDAEGREIISTIGIERFVPASDDAYQTAKKLFNRYKQLEEVNLP